MTFAAALGGCAGGGDGSGGAGGGDSGGGPPIEMCVLTSMKVCQNDVCHGKPPVSSGLTLTNEVLTQGYAALVDAPNHGDPAGCMAGKYKLIDSMSAADSLIYRKLPGMPSPPCGLPMPVIGTFGAPDRECVLRWIESVILATKGP